MGPRDCSVKLKSRWLDETTEYDVANGALCDVFIDNYPTYISEAENSVGNAEHMFIMARSYFDGRHDSPCLTLRTHGISPSNQPLGFRDIYVDYPDLLTNQWVQTARSLWPFRDWTAAFWFVPNGVQLDEMDFDKPVLHFVLSYVTTIPGCPILVRQKMFAVNSMKTYLEHWAIVVPLEADYAIMRSWLDRHPFWFHPQVRTHMSHADGRNLDDEVLDWSAGHVLDLYTVQCLDRRVPAASPVGDGTTKAWRPR